MKSGILTAGAFAVAALSMTLGGCSDSDQELKTTIADCQMDAHRELDEKVANDEKHRFALGASSTACIKTHGFKPVESKTDCVVEPSSAEVGKTFVKPLLECWTK
jgi:hypothetical protein